MKSASGIRRGVSLASVVAGMMASCLPAFAVDSSLDLNRYGHTAWRSSEGFINNRIVSITQTPDGYLWLGTEFGLLRFDGVKAVLWQPPPGQHLPDPQIRGMLVSRDGTLWIGTFKGLASWRDGKLTQHPDLAGSYVDAIVEDREGAIWASGSSPAKLCAFQKGKAPQCYGEDGGFGQAVESIYEDSGGNLWVGASTGLWRWKPGPPKRYSVDAITGTKALSEGDKGILFASGNAIRQLVGEKVEQFSVPGVGLRLTFPRLFRDRKGSLWIGTENPSLIHVHARKADLFSQSDGLSGNQVTYLFEDREGDIWVATSGGLDRFRDEAVTTFTAKRGLQGVYPSAVLAASDGTMWIDTIYGLNYLRNGQFAFPLVGGTTDGKLDGAIPQALLQDRQGRIWTTTRSEVGYLEDNRFNRAPGVPGGIVRAMAEDTAGNISMANQQSGLVRLSPGGEFERIPWTSLGHNDFATALEADPMGGLWVGFYDGGVVYFKDGQVRQSYTAADGLGDGFVDHLRVEPDGTLWAATAAGLTRVKDGHLSTLSSSNGLPCDIVHWSIEDDARSLWLHTACGLIRIARPQLDAWIAATDSSGVQKQKDAMQSVHVTVFDSSDGVRMTGLGAGFSPKVAKSSDGKLWFLASDGVSVIDPRQLAVNTLPPPVHIEQITADHKAYDALPGLRLPPLVRDLEFDYTALSLAIPEKNRFRVKLEGYDRDWQDVGSRRQAYYGNLPPRGYRFRVTASNNSGVWNEAGAFLDFSIAPTYYETNWFRALCTAAFVALLWSIYKFRRRQLQRQFEMTLDARVNERTHIARELHDTLLQSFQGLLLRFQTAANLLPARPEDARQKLESAIDQTARAITEGRDAVQGLRKFTVTTDLPQAVNALGQELADSGGGKTRAVFQVEVEGTPRAKHAITRDEVYRITGEAMRNAFEHAQPRKVEVEIWYGTAQFRVRVRDDGRGIDPSLLSNEGRPGHFGLHGMRERARTIGGRLEIWSEVGCGTEVELSIPAEKAYVGGAGRVALLEKLGKKFHRKETARKL